jgi:preprotein translocase subunit YajC
MTWLPYLVVLVALGGLLLWSQRRRRLQMADEMARIAQIGFGTEVMTTSGLYGTVVGTNDDGTVQLAIAPGVEVKWALAALRDAKSLPAQYRGPLADPLSDEPHDPRRNDQPHEPGGDRPDDSGPG